MRCESYIPPNKRVCTNNKKGMASRGKPFGAYGAHSSTSSEANSNGHSPPQQDAPSYTYNMPLLHTPSTGMITTEQTTFFMTIKKKRFESPEMFILSKFLNLRSKRSESAVKERMNPALMDHVKSLWKTQNGKCAFTGWDLRCDKEAAAKESMMLACVVRIRVDLPWSIGNIGVVCKAASTLTGVCGIYGGRKFAESAVPFIQFRRQYRELGHITACEQWDKVNAARGEVNSMLEKIDTHTLKSLFYEKRLSKCGTGDVRSRENELAFAEHCADLFVAQRARCALTGIPIDQTAQNIFFRPSADRIDNCKQHMEGNVVITTTHVNIMRGSLSIEGFQEMLFVAAFKTL
jgi:hypothetical protein